MSFEVLRAAALNYAPCHYENSRLLFRGPVRRLDVPFVAMIGGTETYGKFIKMPFPAIVEADLGIPCVNFGIANAGVDVFANDSFLWSAANRSEVTVLQVVGAQNLSNRFYTVHPRRNDRFVKASELLVALFPEIDFADFHFTRHMLSALFETSPDRFGHVRKELQAAWVARMQMLCRRYHGRVALLWFSDHAPPPEQLASEDPSKASDPLFVTRPMMDEIARDVAHYEEVVASDKALQAGTDGMVFDEMEALAAKRLLGPEAHGEAATALKRALSGILNENGRA